MVANDFSHVTQLYLKRNLNYLKFFLQKITLYQINAVPDLSQKTGNFSHKICAPQRLFCGAHDYE